MKVIPNLSYCLFPCILGLYIHLGHSDGVYVPDVTNHVTRQLDDLSSKFSIVDKQLDGYLQQDASVITNVIGLDQRATTLLGKSCPEPFFHLRCMDTGRCLPYYLVCDGKADCPNGQDERDCDIYKYIRVGMELSSYRVYDTCTSFEVARGNTTIDAIIHDDLQPNVPKVIITGVSDMSQSIHGDSSAAWTIPTIWIAASRSLYLSLPEAIDSFMQLDLANPDTAHSVLLKQLTGDVCGSYIVEIH